MLEWPMTVKDLPVVPRAKRRVDVRALRVRSTVAITGTWSIGISPQPHHLSDFHIC
jgi:hypothetical protein